MSIKFGSSSIKRHCQVIGLIRVEVKVIWKFKGDYLFPREGQNHWHMPRWRDFGLVDGVMT